MKLIEQFDNISKTKVQEDAAGGAVGGGAVGAVAMPLFTQLISRTLVSNKPRVIKYSESTPPKKKKKKLLGIRESFYAIAENTPLGSNQTFDNAEVLAKLKSLEDKESTDYRDTSTFGLVNDKGNIIRVTVPNDQAEGFEQDLQHFLSDQDESEAMPEVAELIFKLKDRYTIINVEWPEVEEDQEESQELQGTEGGLPGAEGSLPGAEGEGLPGAEGGELPPPDEASAMGGGADTGSVESLLQQVIDMMKADAEARKAEAQAREAEAKTKQADQARQQAMARVKQEEQFMDMEEFNKQQKEKDKEAKRLAQLAKWKHDMADNEPLPAQEPQYDFLPGEEEEEYWGEKLPLNPHTMKDKIKQVSQARGTAVGGSLAAREKVTRGRVRPADIASYLLSRTRQY